MLLWRKLSVLTKYQNSSSLRFRLQVSTTFIQANTRSTLQHKASSYLQVYGFFDCA
jgi:hypothetical protein